MLARNQTAPCLLQELRLFDPAQSFSASVASIEAPPSCTHVFFTNHDRSRIPSPNQLPDNTTIWYIAATCRTCRIHLDLMIDLEQSSVPCPADGHPFHHFIKATPGEALENFGNVYRFECSSENCRAQLLTCFRAPVLTSEDIIYLTDGEALKARTQATKIDYPTLRERCLAESIEVFRTCLQDSLRNETNRDIPTDNKMFRACLGEDIGDILLRLGFQSYATSANGKSYWRLPRPNKHPFNPLWDPSRAQLEDARDELHSLIWQRPESEIRLLKGQQRMPNTGHEDFERVLGLITDRRTGRELQTNASSWQIEQSQSYRRLGIVPEFSEFSIRWAYEQQVRADPEKQSYYLRCFSEIAATRQSETLQTEVAILESLQQQEATGHDPRAAEWSPKTYIEALGYLSVDSGTGDDFVWSMMAAKVAEDPANAAKAREAVQLIANERDSDALRNQLAGSRTGKPQMDIKKAHTTLGVSEEIEAQHLIAQFEMNVKESPSREEDFREALSVIAQGRDSDELRQFLRSQPFKTYQTIAEVPLGEPRAIQNIGNTCYLNSLLQYLFTIKPLRELVRNIDKFREDDVPTHLLRKKVGNSQVKSSQVRRALKFVKQLDALFVSLITERASIVTPSVDLARLTLVNVVDEDVRRRQSTISGPIPPFILTPPQVSHTPMDRKTGEEAYQSTTNLAESPKGIISNDDVMLDIVSEDEDSATASALCQSVQDLTGSSSAAYGNAFGQDAVPSDLNQSIIDLGSRSPNGTSPAVTDVDHLQRENSGFAMLQNGIKDVQAPPVPPRPQSTSQQLESGKDVTQEVENWAQQQDVREVMQNVLSQIRWAIKPEGEEKDGEQIDTISRLFSGKEKYVTTSGAGGEEARVEPFFEIVLYLSGPCGLYEALDRTFDRSGVEDRPDILQYRTIIEIPPVLQISVSRVGYDKKTGTAFKVQDPLELEERIYMDRYMANDAMLKKRQQAWKWKAELQVLRAERAGLTAPDLGLNAAEVLRHTAEHLQNLTNGEINLDPVDAPLLNAMEGFARAAEQEISRLDAQIHDLENKLSLLFGSGGELSYRLHAVFIHRGDARAKSGHWFIYIYDSLQKQWRSYNDETIKLVSDTQPILKPANEWMEGTSSFIVYVREDVKDNIIETVSRSPEPETEVSNVSSEQTLASPLSLSEQPGSQPPPYQGTSVPTNEGGWDINRSSDANRTW